MRALLLKRMETSDQGTFGILYNEDTGEQMYHTGELPEFGGDPMIANERRTDCIPIGTYICKIVYSPKFKRQLYEITNVPNRSAILIHVANYFGNVAKGYRSDVEGCIGLGKSKGILSGQAALLTSAQSIKDFMKEMNFEPFQLTIVKEYADGSTN